MRKIIEEMDDYIYANPGATELQIWEEIAYKIGNLICKFEESK